jgi:hypothetical protein
MNSMNSMNSANSMINVNIHDDEKDERKCLIKWLQNKCELSDNVFEDPGYTEKYKYHFNITDKNHFFYDDDDIDHELNIGYSDYVNDEDDSKHPDDVAIEPFIDYVPRYVSDENSEIESNDNNASEDNTYNIYSSAIRNKNKEGMVKHNIVILPGTNHSNANYLYKRLKILASKFEQYSIPYVNEDPKKPFTDKCKKISIEFEKESFYHFLKERSD